MTVKILEYVGTSDSSIGEYSTFLNKDASLVQTILNYPEVKTFDYLWEKWTIDSYDGDEVKCTCGRDIKFFSKEDVDKYVKTTLKSELEQKFRPDKAFTSQFSPIYCDSSHRYDYIDHNTTSRSISIIPHDETEMFGVWERGQIFKIEEYNMSDGADELTMKYSFSWRMVFITYDKDANFVNRDYNIRLQDYGQKKPSFAVFYSQLLSNIASLGPVERTKNSINTFFNQTHCLKVYLVDDIDKRNEVSFFIEKIPLRYDGVSYQKRSGYPVIKRPIKLESITTEDFLDLLETNFLKKMRSLMPEFSNI